MEHFAYFIENQGFLHSIIPHTRHRAGVGDFYKSRIMFYSCGCAPLSAGFRESIVELRFTGASTFMEHYMLLCNIQP